MAKKSMSNNKLISIVFMAISAGLALWGYQESGGLSSQLSSAFTGSYSDNVMVLYISAAVCFVVGVSFYVKK